VDLLKNEGYSFIETLFSFVIFGLLVTFTVGIYINLFHNAKLVLKREALYLAVKEIDTVVNNKTFGDTTYSNEYKNLEILRKVTRDKNLYHIKVYVIFIPGKTEILNLSMYVYEDSEGEGRIYLN
jgi:hypothetical protein